MNPHEVLTGLASFLQGLHVNGYDVKGDADRGLSLYGEDGALVGYLTFHEELGVWLTQDMRTEKGA